MGILTPYSPPLDLLKKLVSTTQVLIGITVLHLMESFQKNLTEYEMKEVLITLVLIGSTIITVSFAGLVAFATFQILKEN